MLDPFTFYSRMVTMAFGLAETAQRASETMVASQDVITRRTKMIGTAVHSPLEGNYAELSRMVPEKMAAFSQASMAMATDWWAMQSALMAAAGKQGALALQARPARLTELSVLSARNAKLALETFERASAMGGKALRPVHASATGNARRLKKKVA